MSNNKLLWSINFVLAAMVLLLLAVLLLRNSADSPLPNDSSSSKEDRIVAKVGDHGILLSTLEETLLDKYGSELLNQMLDRTAIQQEAEEIGIKISDEEMEYELSRMSQGYESLEEYYRTMKDQLGLSREELQQDIHYKLLLEKIATLDVSVSEKEIEDFLKDHDEEFRDTVYLRISLIVSSTLDQANKVYDSARNGADFGQLASERSLDTITASDGGDLGWLEDNDPFVDAGIMKQAKAMQVGEVSQPIKLDDGYAVIKLTNRKVDSIGTKEQIHDAVKKRLSLQKAPPLKEVVASIRKKRGAVIFDTSLAS
ncbi:peptidylprolyl isomerase [Paenibacillus sp. J2TS4]|uniref:peptidylprolyl isomerase n=1 Tax=Paenibacillus sp. J2TS4 TaxID=2807194 RepID=UPI001B26388A|nr:peptidylprolyl isomerase [Paenibacillus sp. J2TS4]GIP36359.1 foldase protein PrsA [Paenibacillus sp. J2TS4]